MSIDIEVFESVSLNRIFLDLDNPRFEPVKTEKNAIEYLCLNENVYPLAAHIVEYGINPLERFALKQASTTKKSRRPSYTVAEGNRRLCALKLLNDPDLAPTKLKKSFKSLSEKWSPIETVPAVIFKNDESLRKWLQVTHGGEQGGIGRKRWTSDQQARFSGGGRNNLALQFLDWAQDNSLISEKDREGKLTTVQRFLSNEVFRETIGFERDDSGQLQVNRKQEDLISLAKIFIIDLLDGTHVNSRMNRKAIIEYARKLGNQKAASGQRVQTVPLNTASSGKNKKKNSPPPKPKPPTVPKFISHSIEIDEAIKAIDNFKLASLYHSITTLDASEHTPLVSIGIWAFIETLTANMGRNENTDFCAFLSKEKLKKLGIEGPKNGKVIIAALKRIQDFGNHTKHHAKAATFHVKQIHNDMQVLEQTLIFCIKSLQSG